MVRNLIILVFSFHLIACGGSESENLSNDKIIPRYSISTFGDGNVIAKAEFGAHEDAFFFSNRIKLSGDDKIFASAEGQEKRLTEDSYVYSTNFSGLDAANTLYEFILSRKSDTQKIISSVHLPAPFTIISPINNSTIRHSENISFMWNTDQDQLRLEYSGICDDIEVPEGYLSIEKTSAVINTEDILPEELRVSLSCQINLQLSDLNLGNLSDEFSFGSIIASQIREINISIIQ